MTTPTSKRGRGRPAKGAPLNPTDRTELWRQQLRAARGKQLHVNLGGTAWEALQHLAPKGARGPYIEDLILKAWREGGR